MSFDRRALLKSGISSLPFFALERRLQAIAGHAALASQSSDRRLLTIFLRGGNDGLNTVIPFGDPDYQLRRPNIFFGEPNSGAAREAVAFKGYNKVGIHPDLALLLDTTQPSSIGHHIAFLHRVGNLTGQRSHFTEMQLVETGVVQYSATAEGWIPQLLPVLGSTLVMPAVSVSERLMRMFLSTSPSAMSTHVRGAYSSATPSSPQRNLAIPFATPATPGKRLADAVRSTALSGPSAYQVVGSGAFLRGTTAGAIDNLGALRNALSSFAHDPAFPSVSTDPGYSPKYKGFFERFEEAVRFLSSGLSNFAGVELGGWDTHDDQLAEHSEVLKVLARAVRGAHDALLQSGQEFLIMVVSEFGRTVADNGSGTDHGVGGVCMAVGSTVKSGIYNCSHPTWTQSAGTPTGVAPWRRLVNTPQTGVFANAVVPVTDFRVPFVEVAKKFFGLDLQSLPLSGIGQSWRDVDQNAANLLEYRMLDFLN